MADGNIVETDALLPKPAGQRRKPGSGGGGGGLGLCSLCRSGPLLYADIGDDAAEAVDNLITELSIMPDTSPTSSNSYARDPRVVDAVQRMWTAVAVDASDKFHMAPPKIPSPEWRRLGFQGDDPVTDCRAAGLAGVTYLARVVEEYAEARSIGGNCDVEIPLGVAAINILYMLRCHLALLREPPASCPCCGVAARKELTHKQPLGGRHLRGFAMLLVEEPDAFFHIYALTLLVTANLWRKKFPVGTSIAIPSASAAAALSAHTGGGGGGSGGGHRPSRSNSAAGSRSASTSRRPAPPGRAGSTSTTGHSNGSAAVRPPNSTRRETSTSVVTASSDGGAASSHAAAGGAGDPRLLYFNSLLAEAREIMMESLAMFPPDLTSLRVRLYQRLKGTHPAPAPGVGGVSVGEPKMAGSGMSTPSTPMFMTPNPTALAGTATRYTMDAGRRTGLAMEETPASMGVVRGYDAPALLAGGSMGATPPRPSNAMHLRRTSTGPQRSGNRGPSGGPAGTGSPLVRGPLIVDLEAVGGGMNVRPSSSGVGMSINSGGAGRVGASTSTSKGMHPGSGDGLGMIGWPAPASPPAGDSGASGHLVGGMPSSMLVAGYGSSAPYMHDAPVHAGVVRRTPQADGGGGGGGGYRGGHSSRGEGATMEVMGDEGY